MFWRRSRIGDAKPVSTAPFHHEDRVTHGVFGGGTVRGEPRQLVSDLLIAMGTNPRAGFQVYVRWDDDTIEPGYVPSGSLQPELELSPDMSLT